MFTIVGAGSWVLGVGLADDVLVYLVPLVLIVTSGERERDSLVWLLGTHPLVGPDGGIRIVRMGLHEQHVSQRRFPPGEKVAAGGGAIKQHISPNAQLTKQTWQPALYQPFSLLWARRPLGWQREMHRLERYRSRQFGGSSALNHCLLFKGKSFLPQQRNSIETTAFCSSNLYFTLSCIVILKITHRKNVTYNRMAKFMNNLWHGADAEEDGGDILAVDWQEKMLSLVVFFFVL